eukprot:5995784-Prymnesium_polylepis.2
MQPPADYVTRPPRVPKCTQKGPVDSPACGRLPASLAFARLRASHARRHGQRDAAALLRAGHFSHQSGAKVAHCRRGRRCRLHRLLLHDADGHH